MMQLRVFVVRLWSLLRRRRFDDRIDEELQAHLAFAIEDNMARGMSEAEARLAARRRLGNVAQTRERWRDTRGFPALDALGQDLRYAVRTYRKTPVFTAVAILTLTLAIGANTAIFSLLNALILRDLPVHDPATLVQVSTTTTVSTYESGLTFPMFQRVSERTDVFSAVIGWNGSTVLTVATEREQTHGAVWVVGGNFFSELGVQPSAGRGLGADDVDAATLRPAPVAVIGYAFWQRHYGGDASAIGQRLEVEGQPFTIVGVAPRAFTALAWAIEPDVLLPLTAYPALNDSTIDSLRRGTGFWVRTTARLKPGVTIDQARAALEASWPALKEATSPPGYTGPQRDRFQATRLKIASARAGVEPGLRNRFVKPFVIVFGIAALILLIACVNLASLLLARAAAREHEIGLRLALGAARWRVARQLLVEGLLLSGIGAACGVLFAHSMSSAIVELIFGDYSVPASIDVAPDARLLLFTTAIAITAGVLISVAPAVRATKGQASALFQASRRHFTGVGRSGRLLVGVQVALSLVLVANAGLLVRTLLQIRAVSSGMRPDSVLVAFPAPLPGGYKSIDNNTYYPDVIARIQAIAGVSQAAAALSKPAGGSDIGGGEPVTIVDHAADGTGVRSQFVSVSPGFFDVLGIGVLNGRDVAWGDDSRAPRVAVVSETLARRLFPGASAIGRRVRVGVLPRRQDLQIVGVVADARVYNLKDDNLAVVYAPALQEPDASWKCFVIRGRGVSLAEINHAVLALGREQVRSMQPLARITDGALLQERLTAALAGFFGVLALLLAGIGLYGLLSYTVSLRRREIGIRAALGAEPARVVRDVIGDGLRVSLGGVAVGFAAALAVTPLVKSLLFGVTEHDPMTLVAAPALLVAIAIVASVLPAVRAARIDPMIALRAD